MPRIFVAARLPRELAQAVGEVQRALRARIVDVKWVEVENLHLTLRFFGDIDPVTLERVADVVRTVALATTPFTVVLEGVGCFPPRGRPRVVWVGLGEGATRLSALAAALDDAFEAAGLGREARPFRPHLTIGRLRTPDRRRRGRGPRAPAMAPQATAEIQAAVAGAGCGPLVLGVRALAVVESQLRPGGPFYRDADLAPLGADSS